MTLSPSNVSVVMATHNGARFIEEQLKSIINQTYRPAEIIISDDASTDQTLEIVKDLTQDCGDRVRVIAHSKALGFRENFLFASSLARSEFVAFCDQDDIWNLQKLEKCSKWFNDQSISMIVHAASIIDSSSKITGNFRQGIHTSRIRPPLSYDPWLTFFGFSMVFRRDLLDLYNRESRFIDFIVPSEKISHDRWIMFLAQMVGSTAEIEESLVMYRQHDTNLFGKKSRRAKSKLLEAKEESHFYVLAASQMLDIAHDLPEWTETRFPNFDRAKCVSFLSRALVQLEGRDKIYASGSFRDALQNVVRCLMKGEYRNVHDKRTRWRSIAKDFVFAFLIQIS